jgi:Tol biopolymer transport system component
MPFSALVVLLDRAEQRPEPVWLDCWLEPDYPNPATLDPATHSGVCSPCILHKESGEGDGQLRQFKHLFLTLTVSALALTAVPASAGVAVTTTRVSVNSAGASGNPCSGCSSNSAVSISATGRFVAFSDNAPNLVEGDRNFRYDVFVRDRVRGETTRVSVGSAGAEGNNDSAFPSISANGRFVAFLSLASNLVRGDRNHRADVFVRDIKRGETTRVGVSSTGEEANDGSIWLPAISDNGRFVAFFSRSTNLVPNDHNGLADFFVRDRKRGETTRVSVSSTGEEQTPGPGAEELGIVPAISHNGRFVAFFSASTNLVEGDHNGTDDIFVRDRKLGETTRVSVSSTGEEANGSSLFYPSISANGRFVAFTSYASNLVPGDANGAEDVFVRDRKRGVTTRIRESDKHRGVYSGIPSITDNGRFVAFESPAPDLVEGDRNDSIDVFLRDRKRAKTTLLSVSSEGTQGNSESSFPAISAHNGRFVAFSSLASSLVEGDRFNTADTFVRGPLR